MFVCVVESWPSVYLLVKEKDFLTLDKICSYHSVVVHSLAGAHLKQTMAPKVRFVTIYCFRMVE